MKKGKAFIGTSGWQYDHWIGTYYPADVAKTRVFPYYLKDFSTVEINNSFYRWPSIETFEKWEANVPAGFTYSIKASRFIIHMKKLKDCEDAVTRMITNVITLKKKLGPILFQLPPVWKVNTERLIEFTDLLPKGLRYVFEFRNLTWDTPEVLSILNKKKIAFCIYELDGYKTANSVTTNFVYVRLHGPGAKYQGNYSSGQIGPWAAQIKLWMAEGKDVYVYFDNDQSGYAAFNAKELNQQLMM